MNASQSRTVVVQIIKRALIPMVLVNVNVVKGLLLSMEQTVLVREF